MLAEHDAQALSVHLVIGIAGETCFVLAEIGCAQTPGDGCLAWPDRQWPGRWWDRQMARLWADAPSHFAHLAGLSISIVFIYLASAFASITRELVRPLPPLCTLQAHHVKVLRLLPDLA